MYRRFLTLLLLPTLLLTQWVNGSRCMGGCRTAEQNCRPHVHLAAVLPGTPETKGCGCQRTPNTTRQALVASDAPAATDQSPCRGPDANVLYLSFDAANFVRTGDGIAVVDVGDHGQQPACLDLVSQRPGHKCDRPDVPPRPSPPYPVYVLVCALLI